MVDRYVGGYGAGYVLPEEAAAPSAVVTHAPLTPDLRVLIDWVNDVNPLGVDTIALAPVWTDVTAKVRADPGVTIHRGRERALDKNEAGTMTVVFDNFEREFDPESTSGFSASPAFRHIRTEAVTPRTTTAFKMAASKVGDADLVGGGESRNYSSIYDGWIESWDFDYPARGNDATATARCMDVLGVMAKDMATGFPYPGGFFPIEGIINTVCNLVAYAGRTDPTGYTTNPGDRDMPSEFSNVTSSGGPKPALVVPLNGWAGSSRRTPMDDCVDSEGGNFFINRKGQVAYRDRDWPLRPAGKIRVAMDAELFADASRNMDETLVYNYVYFVNATEEFYVNLEDKASQAHYLKRAWPGNGTSLIYNDFGIQQRAEDILNRYREPQVFLSKLDMSNLVTDWRVMLEADLWDIITLEITLPNGDVIEQRSMIEGIEITTPSRQLWNLIWWLSLPIFPNLLSQDAAGFEGDTGDDLVGSTGGWTAETNCVLWAQDEQIQAMRHGGGRRDLPIYYTFEQRPVYANEGVWVLMLDAVAAGNVSALSPLVPVAPRTIYVGKAFVRVTNFGTSSGVPDQGLPSDNSTGIINRTCTMQFNWYDASSTLLSTVIGDAVVVQNEPITEWWIVQHNARAPDAAAFLQVRLRSVGTGKAGLYVDNVTLKRGG